MTSLLIRLFVRDHKNTTDPKVRLSYAQTAGIVGIVTNLLLVCAKMTVGLLSGSISIVADALNNLSDAGSSIVTLVGFRLSGKPADAEHPYGHARIEYITGLIISMSVLFIGLQLAIESFDKILHPALSEISIATLITLFIAILVKLWQGFFYRKISHKIDSEALKASATDSFSDVILTATVLLGALLSRLFAWKTDGWFGMAVAVFILIAGIRLVIETSSPLLGAAPDPAFIKSISEKILSYEGVLGVHDLVVHSYGAGFTFVSAHAEVDSNVNILDSHELMDNIEMACKNEMGVQLVLHMDPIVIGDPRVEALKTHLSKIIDDIYPGMHFHDFRVVFGKGHTNLIFDVVVPVSFPVNDAEISKILQTEFEKIDPSLHTVITVDRDYTSTLNMNE